MDFLTLVNRARRECGISSAALTTFAGLSVEDTKIKDWVADAWRDLQLHRPDWGFMRKRASFTTVNGQVAYTTAQANASDVADWIRDTFSCYLTATGYPDEQVLPFMDYATWHNVYEFGASRTQSNRPMAVTIKPGAKTLAVGPVPPAGYTIEADYYRTPTELVLITDDPGAVGNGLETRWHMLLVYMSMRSYAAFEAAAEVMTRADYEVKRLLARLEIDQMPPFTFGPPIA